MEEFPKEYLESIGRMVVRFNLLETILEDTIIQSIYADTSLTSRLISGELFSVLRVKFESIANYLFLDNKSINEIKSLCDLLGEINTKRNNFIHTVRYFNEQNEIRGRQTTRKPNKKNEIEKDLDLSPQSLNDLLSLIEDAISELLKFQEKIIDLYYPKTQ